MNRVIKNGMDNPESGLTFINTLVNKEKSTEKFMTKYSVAWNKYLTTSDYKTSVEQMSKHGMKQPYIDNILRLSFDAGWNFKR